MRSIRSLVADSPGNFDFTRVIIINHLFNEIAPITPGQSVAISDIKFIKLY